MDVTVVMEDSIFAWEHPRIVAPWGNSAPTQWNALHFCLEVGSTLHLPGQQTLTASWLPAVPETLERILAGRDDPSSEVHLDAIGCQSEQSVHVSFRSKGMRYQPLGCAYDRTLKKCLIDQKVPQFERDRLPIIQNDQGELIWVPGLPPSEQGRVTPGTKKLLRLTYLKTLHSFKV
jgi:tRNA(Ile)-lysidine synthase